MPDRIDLISEVIGSGSGYGRRRQGASTRRRTAPSRLMADQIPVTWTEGPPTGPMISVEQDRASLSESQARRRGGWVNGRYVADVASDPIPRQPTRQDPLGQDNDGPIDPSYLRRLADLYERWVPRDGSAIDPLNGPRMVNMAEVTELARATDALLAEVQRLQELDVERRRQIRRQAASIDELRSELAQARRDGRIPMVADVGAEEYPLHEDHRARLRLLARRYAAEQLRSEGLAGVVGSVEPLLDELDRLDDLLMAALTTRPCHRADHFLIHDEGTVCEDQVQEIGVALIAGLGLVPEWLPRALHGDECVACKNNERWRWYWLESGATAGGPESQPQPDRSTDYRDEGER